MPLAGLLNFLQTNQLHLARADSFEDLLEGRFGLTAIRAHLNSTATALDDFAIGGLKADCFLSCWHLSAAESLAMWRLYGKSDNSIAIVSDVGEVMNAGNVFCERLEYCGMFGEVIYDNYIDNGRMQVSTIGLPFGRSQLPMPMSVQLLFCKAPAFEFEKEWRLVIWKRRANQSFIRILLPDVRTFVKKIVISPEAQAWVEETIRQVVQVQFDLRGIPVERSGLGVHFRTIR
jgi:hypothetical protein